MSIKVIENFFDDELYKEVYETSKHVFKNKSAEYSFVTSQTWHDVVVKDSFPVLAHVLYPDSELFLKIKNAIESKTEYFVKGNKIMFYYWTRLSYAPWHNDSVHQAGMTIYLNDDWHRDFGGFFLYKENDEIKGFIPKQNVAILQSDGIKHCVTPINYNGNVRYTIQVFLKK